MFKQKCQTFWLKLQCDDFLLFAGGTVKASLWHIISDVSLHEETEGCRKRMIDRFRAAPYWKTIDIEKIQEI